MSECPFCNIIAGDLVGSFVYQDEICSAIMDIQPINDGHLLIMPNEHIADLADIPPEVASHIFLIAQKVRPPFLSRIRSVPSSVRGVSTNLTR